MNSKITYTFTAELWQSARKGGWFIMTLTTELSNEIRNALKWQEEGWGRLKAEAIILGHQWQTAIWYDTKRKSYLLPIKSEIRKKAGLALGKTYKAQIKI